MKLAKLLTAALLLPTLAQAHPGHTAFDLSAGMPHAGHVPEWLSLLIFLATIGGFLGASWLANRRR